MFINKQYSPGKDNVSNAKNARQRWSWPTSILPLIEILHSLIEPPMTSLGWIWWIEPPLLPLGWIWDCKYIHEKIMVQAVFHRSNNTVDHKLRDLDFYLPSDPLQDSLIPHPARLVQMDGGLDLPFNHTFLKLSKLKIKDLKRFTAYEPWSNGELGSWLFSSCRSGASRPECLVLFFNLFLGYVLLTHTLIIKI